jgi:carbon monoxide dehydrogenase subunit G
MLRFEGNKDFPRPPADVWAKLSDPRFLVGCVPDVETVKEQAADRAAFVVRPGFAFVRGTLDVELRVLEAAAPSSARLRAQSKGIGSTSAVEATLSLSPQGAGTRVHWAAEVKELGGLLKMVPSGLIQGAAQKVIGDVWAAVESRLAAEGG